MELQRSGFTDVVVHAPSGARPHGGQVPALTMRAVKVLSEIAKDECKRAERHAKYDFPPFNATGNSMSRVKACDEQNMRFLRDAGAVLSSVAKSAASLVKHEQLEQCIGILCSLVYLEQKGGECTSMAQGQAIQQLGAWIMAQKELGSADNLLLPVGPGRHLYAFLFQGRWCFTTLEAEWPLEHASMLNMSSFPATLDVKCNDFYMPGMRVCSSRDRFGLPVVERGCAISIYTDRCSQLFDEWRSVAPGSDLEIALEVLRDLLDVPEATQSDALAFLEKARCSPDGAFLVMHRTHGLTHPTIPFAVSARVIFMLDESDISQIRFNASRYLGLDLHEGSRQAYVGITFPPPLSDVDKRWQSAFLASESGSPGATKCLEDATEAVMLDELGDASTSLGDLPDAEFEDILEHANALVRRALTALREVELCRKRLTVVATDAVLEALDAAMQEVSSKARLREEWARREHWVARQSVVRSGPKKGKNRSRVDRNLAAPDLRVSTQKIKQVVNSVQQRSETYQQRASDVCGMQKLGFIQRQDIISSEGSDYFNRECIEVLVPRSGRIVGGAADSSCKRPALPQHSHWSHALDASSARDAELASRHSEELSLKLALEMSLAGA
eukprot:TRINITY_DN28114_c0_g1_i1.p1 TRINITY_DN28114_c0_g1~~TRINITY_DN28114_c0_g1_i1.p1  ORF type:complete len:616 (+),score=106.82 TRINITY_DN28114_c0_g1_i1:128-1975(+)